MRKTIVLLAVLGLMSATPAMADIVYTPQPVTGDYGDIGLYDPANPDTLNTVFVDPAYQSDILEFDFAIHMSAASYWAESITFAFMYDNSSLDVIGAHPIGTWETYNYENYEWPNSEAGEMVTVNGLTHGFTSGTSEYLPNSGVVPFLHVTLHVNSAQFSALNDFGIVALTLYSAIGSEYDVYADGFGYFGGTVHEVPEPATASLLIAGLAALAGGFVRRRR